VRPKSSQLILNWFTLISKNISNPTISRQHIMCSCQHFMCRSTWCFVPSFHGPCSSHIMISIYVDMHTSHVSNHRFLRTTSDQLTLSLLTAVLPGCFRTPGIFPEFPTCPNSICLPSAHARIHSLSPTLLPTAHPSTDSSILLVSTAVISMFTTPRYNDDNGCDRCDEEEDGCLVTSWSLVRQPYHQ
jgi:hypothetical protein